jgi:hypothetical protein
VLDLSVTGDKSDSPRVDPHDLTTTSNPKVPMQSLTNSLLLPTLLEQDLHDQEDQFLYGKGRMNKNYEANNLDIC